MGKDITDIINMYQMYQNGFTGVGNVVDFY